jgi:hypothetical protein
MLRQLPDQVAVDTPVLLTALQSLLETIVRAV